MSNKENESLQSDGYLLHTGRGVGLKEEQGVYDNRNVTAYYNRKKEINGFILTFS